MWKNVNATKGYKKSFKVRPKGIHMYQYSIFSTFCIQLCYHILGPAIITWWHNIAVCWKITYETIQLPPYTDIIYLYFLVIYEYFLYRIMYCSRLFSLQMCGHIIPKIQAEITCHKVTLCVYIYILYISYA